MRHAMYCAYGHALIEGNVVDRRKDGQVVGRRCKTCQNRYQRETYARRAAEKSAGK